MAAGPTRTRRFVAISYVAMLLLSAFAALAPTAIAAPPATVTVVSANILVGGVPATATTPLKIGDPMIIEVVADVDTTGCAAPIGSRSPRIFISVSNMLTFGGSSASWNGGFSGTAVQGDDPDTADLLGNTNPVWRVTARLDSTPTAGFRVNESITNGQNGVPTAFNLLIGGTCTSDGGNPAVSEPTPPASRVSKTTDNQVLLDNIKPTITANFDAGPKKVGDSFSIAWSAQPTDLKSYQVNIGQFTTGYAQNGQTVLAASVPTLGPFTLADTGNNAPAGTIVLTDLRDHTTTIALAPANYDARVPIAPSLTVVPVVVGTPPSDGPALRMDIPLPAAPNDDVTAYTFTITPTAGGTARTITCPGAHCSGAPSTGSWTVTNTMLGAAGQLTIDPGVQYTTSVVARDAAGNVGPNTAVNARTLEMPRGSVTVSAVSGGNGGKGSQIKLDLDSGSQHVGQLHADLRDVTGDATQSSVPFTGNPLSLTVTIGSGGNGAENPTTIPVTITSPDGTIQKAATVAYAPGLTIDAKAPDAPTSVTATAKENGVVDLAFTDPNPDSTKYRVTATPVSAGVPIVFPDANVGTVGAASVTFTGAQLDKEYSFTVHVLDEKGNVGAVGGGSTVLATPATVPVSIKITTLGSQFQNGAASACGITDNGACYMRAYPVFSGTLTFPDGDRIPDGSGELQFAFVNMTSGTARYWDGSGTGTFTSTETWLNVPASGITQTGWSLSKIKNDLFANGVKMDGSFELRMRLTSASAAAPKLDTYAFVLDNQTPAKLQRSGMRDNQILSTGMMLVEQQHTNVLISLNVTDNETFQVETHSGLKNATLRFVKLQQGRAPSEMYNATGSLTIECPGPRCTTFTPGSRVGELLYNANLTGLPIGDYVLNVTVEDRARNAANFTIDNQIVRVVPRLRVDELVYPPTLADGRITLAVLGGYDNATSIDPANSCRYASQAWDHMCKFTDVTLEGRNGAGSVVFLGKITSPRADPERYRAGSDAWAWNWSPINGVLPSTLDVNNPMEVRAVARIRTTATQEVTFATPWVSVRTPSTGGIQITRPDADWRTNATGTISFAANFSVTSPPAAPWMDVSVVRLSDGATILTTDDIAPDIDGAKLYAQRVGTAAPQYKYNWTWNVSIGAMPDGQYKIAMKVMANNSAGGAPIELAARDRFVSLAAATPTLGDSTTFPNIVVRQESWVNRTFTFSGYAQHGFANVTGWNFSLGKNAKAVGDKTVLNNTEDGFEATFLNTNVVNAVGSTPRRTYFNVSVTLPPSPAVAHADAVTLRVNYTTDIAAWNAADPRAKAEFSMPLRLDATPPAVGVETLRTNQTGDVASPGVGAAEPLTFYGFVTDQGAGVDLSRVEVRVYDVTNDRTLNFANVTTPHSTWRSGEQNIWGTSTLRNTGWGSTTTDGYARDIDVYLVDGARADLTQQVFWKISAVRTRYDANGNAIGNWIPLELDRNSTYRVDVRATDNLTLASGIVGKTVSFDTKPPVLSFPSGGALHGIRNADTGDLPPSQVSWHGAGRLQVTVSDNNCLSGVSLFGISPSGKTVGPFNFTPTSGASCPGRAGSETFVLDLKQSPLVIDEVGNYTYWFEATDTAGNNASTPNDRRTYKLEVVDNTQATVRFLRPEPHTVAAGTRSRVVAEIFENHKMDHVKVSFYNLSVDGSLGANPYRGTMRYLNDSTNGTGIWVAETDTDLGITNLRTGDYVWLVEPYDWRHATTCTPQCHRDSTIVRVSDDAPPFVVLDEPAAGTSFVNATPTFKFRAIAKDLDASGIELTIGNSTANMTKVTPTLTALPPVGGNATGFIVEHRSAALESGNVSVKLKITTKVGATNATEVLTFAVDAGAPTVTSNVTGTRPIDDVTYAVSGTRVELAAADDLSGIASLTTSVNGGTPAVYTAALSPPTSGATWTIVYTATDRAGNKVTGTLTYALDRTGPSVNVNKHGDDLLVTVTDEGVGVDTANVTAHYAYGDASTFTTVKLTKGTGNTYSTLLPGNATETGLRYYIEAKDRLGNAGSFRTAGDAYVIEKEKPAANLPPTVRITQPSVGASVRDVVELRWVAEDPEDEDVAITIALREPGGSGTFLMTAGENNGTFRVDLRNAAEGAYSLVVTATDGENTEQATTTFTVEHLDPVQVVTPPPAKPNPNQAVQFGVKLNPGAKTIQSATYNVTRDGVAVSSGLLRQQGTTWSGTIVPTDSGNYKVFVSVAYADGTQEPSTEVAAFEVASVAPPPTGSGAFPPSMITLVILSLATIALAAYAAFVRWPR